MQKMRKLLNMKSYMSKVFKSSPNWPEQVVMPYIIMLPYVQLDWLINLLKVSDVLILILIIMKLLPPLKYVRLYQVIIQISCCYLSSRVFTLVYRFIYVEVYAMSLVGTLLYKYRHFLGVSSWTAFIHSLYLLFDWLCIN